ncbi:hypothetical protein ACWGEU_36810 [Streptomyces goshikiensis]
MMPVTDAHEILKKGAELQTARHAALGPLAEILAERMRLEGEIRAAQLRLEKTHAEKHISTRRRPSP